MTYSAGCRARRPIGAGRRTSTRIVEGNPEGMITKSTEGLPKSAASLARDLLRIGVEPGMTLMVHSSLSAIGWVVGGAETVVRVLVDGLGSRGTLVMPCATPLCADPAQWAGPEVPSAWLDIIRQHLPVFDPETTPTSLGAIPEMFRNWPGVTRSHHPLESVCARGPEASNITRQHPLEFSEGRNGPFGKLYELDSRILLLGVGFNRCTALHFAESLVEKRRVQNVRFPAFQGGQRIWIEVPNVADDNGAHFPTIGRRYLETGRARQGCIGDAVSTLVSMRDLVGFATRYFEDTL